MTSDKTVITIGYVGLWVLFVAFMYIMWNDGYDE